MYRLNDILSRLNEVFIVLNDCFIFYSDKYRKGNVPSEVPYMKINFCRSHNKCKEYQKPLLS